MSAAYGFMANPAGLSPQLPQPVPAGIALPPRHTLLPASPMTAHATSKLLVSLQAHMFQSQFSLTPGSHEKHSLLRATPVLSLTNIRNSAFNLECKSGPAWYQLVCRAPTMCKRQMITCASQPAAVPHGLCKVLLLMRALCNLWLVPPTPACTKLHFGSIYLVSCVCTHCVQGQNIAPGGSRRSGAGERMWSGKPQQGGPVPAVGSPREQPVSGKASRGRSPVPDPTGAEDSPLSQVMATMSYMLCHFKVHCLLS